MRFNSLTYWLFLALVVVVLWLLPGRRSRRGWLLAASYVFYASWHWPYLLLLVSAVTFNHLGARWIVAAEDRRRRGAFVLAGDVLLLALFKYLDWLIESADAVGGLLGLPAVEPLGWVLPLGISFYLFQAMSYVIDLVRKRETLHPFWDFQLYIAFFPQLIAGPIMRAKELLPQLESSWRVGAEDLRLGLRWVISGLFVKIVLADGLAPQVDHAFARTPQALGSFDVAVMAVAFGLQVYFDFSAYSRIALGSARLCGLKLVENFDFPYSARTPTDFWARWHMSLSRWIRDYLFFPLASGRPGLAGLCWAALVSMTLCGLWHGAGWTFVLWGLYHGLLIAGYHLFTFHRRRPVRRGAAVETDGWTRLRRQASGVLATLATFSLVSLGWLLFRSSDLDQAFGLLGRVLTPWLHTHRALPGTFYLHTALLLGAVWLAPRVKRWLDRLLEDRSTERSPLRVWGLGLAEGTVLGLLMVLCLVYLRGQTTFIYFQF